MLDDAPDSMGRGHRLFIRNVVLPPHRGYSSDATTQGGGPFPRGNGPPPCMRHRLTADECPHWDSNPEHKDFKSSVSANWTMGARLAKTEHKTPLFHESRVTHIRSSVPNNPRRSRLIREGADKAAKQPSRGEHREYSEGRRRRPKSSAPPVSRPRPKRPHRLSDSSV